MPPKIQYIPDFRFKVAFFFKFSPFECCKVNKEEKKFIKEKVFKIPNLVRCPDLVTHLYC